MRLVFVVRHDWILYKERKEQDHLALEMVGVYDLSLQDKLFPHPFWALIKLG